MVKQEAAVLRGECNEEGVPYRYFCPISHAIFEDPVHASDGHVYERRYIEHWITNCKNNNANPTSPMTNYEIYDFVTPNHHLRNEIHNWLTFKAKCAYECVAAGYLKPSYKKPVWPVLDYEQALRQATRRGANWKCDTFFFTTVNRGCISEDGYPWWNKTRQLLQDRWIKVLADQICCDRHRRLPIVRWGEMVVLLQALLSIEAEEHSESDSE